MIGVTADSNIYISGLVYAGPPRRFLDAARAGLFQLSFSVPLLDEICRVLRDKFLWSQERLDDLTVRLEKFTKRVAPTITLDVVKTIPTTIACSNARWQPARSSSSLVITTFEAWPLWRHPDRESGRFHQTSSLALISGNFGLSRRYAGHTQ